MNNFNSINHRPLQIYNRCVVTANLMEDQGRAAVEDYLSQFSEEDKIDMAHMFKLVKKLGPKRVQNMVTAGMQFSDDDYVGEEN